MVIRTNEHEYMLRERQNLNDAKIGIQDSNGHFFQITQSSVVSDELAEFYRKKEDERLGRWRRPEYPDYVVYEAPAYPDTIRIFNEKSGFWTEVNKRDVMDGSYQGWGRNAAVAYFEAHVEPKPWHDAKVGDIWVLTVEHGEGYLAKDRAYRVTPGDKWADVDALFPSLEKLNTRIVNARKIYERSI